MPKDWREVKDRIEEEIDRIWWEEPEEVTMSKLGIFPSGAGVDGQCFSNLFFLVSDTQAMGWKSAGPALKRALENPVFSVEHCKKMWEYMTVHIVNLLGGMDPPNCPAPWLNLGRTKVLCEEIMDCLDTVETKEELRDLLWSWFNYVNCLNRWFSLVFPWHLGLMFPTMKPEGVKKASRFLRLDTH